MDLKTIGKGQATLSYAIRNELGYRFKTHRNIVADIETSGFDPTRDNIIEIAALKVNPDNLHFDIDFVIKQFAWH